MQSDMNNAAHWTTSGFHHRQLVSSDTVTFTTTVTKFNEI